jgi:small subunit ribosomal protein S2
MNEDGRMATLSKRERLQIARQRQKLEKNLGSIADLTRLPAAIFVVDIMKEHIAINEAKKLGIPTFAIVDTNSDPTLVDFAIPANDDATRSIDKIMGVVADAVAKGLAERKQDKDKAKAERETKKEEKPEAKKEEAKAESK